MTRITTRRRAPRIEFEQDVKQRLTDELQRAGCVIAAGALAHCALEFDGTKLSIIAAPYYEAMFRRMKVRGVIWQVLGHETELVVKPLAGHVSKPKIQRPTELMGSTLGGEKARRR